eukprot:jgi/Psemu1/57264/gm1.57264_g
MGIAPFSNHGSNYSTLKEQGRSSSSDSSSLSNLLQQQQEYPPSGYPTANAEKRNKKRALRTFPLSAPCFFSAVGSFFFKVAPTAPTTSTAASGPVAAERVLRYYDLGDWCIYGVRQSRG